MFFKKEYNTSILSYPLSHLKYLQDRNEELVTIMEKENKGQYKIMEV